MAGDTIERWQPEGMIAFLLLTAATFSLFGFITGLWAKGFEQLQFILMLVVTPLTFLGGAFYSIDMLPPAWRTVTWCRLSDQRLPLELLRDGGRSVGVSLAMTLGFFVICLAVVGWIFRTGDRLKG
jgi:ABC-2 type transport system permease protein